MNKNVSDVDIVILWVDGADPDWIASFNKFSMDKKILDTRYKDWDTIKYVFRGIEKFMPWVRKIHFVTCGQKPNWMVSNHPKLNFVFHSDIFLTKDILPVFNSSSIELNFERIPDLSEKFIYFNDDTLILRPADESRFFVDNQPVDFLIESLPRRGRLYNKIRKPDSWSSMINNCIDLINGHFYKNDYAMMRKEHRYSNRYKLIHRISNLFFSIEDKYLAFKHYHHPQPYLKKTIINVNKKFSDAVNDTIESKFRNSKNISQALYRYSHLASGDFYPIYYDDHFCKNISSINDAKKCAKMINNKRFVCVNDSISADSIEYAECRSIIINALDGILREKSTFEKIS